jgi:hypothetical protein
MLSPASAKHDPQMCRGESNTRYSPACSVFAVSVCLSSLNAVGRLAVVCLSPTPGQELDFARTRFLCGITTRRGETAVGGSIFGPATDVTTDAAGQAIELVGELQWVSNPLSSNPDVSCYLGYTRWRDV